MIGVSSSGKTSPFGGEYSGSNPFTPAMKDNIMKIAVFEDNEVIGSLIKFKLESQGVEVELHSNSTLKDVEQVFEFKPDAILIDLMLPHYSGEELLVLFKKDERSKDIPLIVITAKTTESNMLNCFGLGATDFIKKPFSLVELLARINVHVNKQNERKISKKTTPPGKKNN